MASVDARHEKDLAARQRAGVRRTAWICAVVAVVLLGLFLAQHA